MNEGEHILFYCRRGRLLHPPNFYVYAPIFKIRSFNLVRIVLETGQDIKKCSRVYILAVIDNRISQMGQFELKSFLQVVEMKNDWSKKSIIWVILRHGNGSRMKFYLTPIIPGGYLHICFLNDYEQKTYLTFKTVILFRGQNLHVSMWPYLTYK